ncbi:Auxilin-related protein 2 [Sesamum alatum]|uniref:Auxilin-related protein 2 n=1 Tax=Sesamum alatum TaxID=300844 RepID=A0AAE1XXC4_9LAMI|nr:Auxilin-related protein 2 [Sesamum alatum]
MDDLDMLGRDFGFGPRGKSNPMRSGQADRRRNGDPSFSDVFGEPAKYTPSSNSVNDNKNSTMSDFDYDSIFNSSKSASEANKSKDSSSKTSSFPVYDKPVYDEDIFDGLPGMKNKPASSTVRFEDDVFASISSPASSKNKNENNDFDDLLGNLTGNKRAGGNMRSTSAKSSSNSKGFDDLLAEFGSGNSAASNRPMPESNWGSVSVGGSKHGNVRDDPFVVLESSPNQGSSSSGVFTDPLEGIGKLGKSRSARVEASSGGGRGFDDLDPLNSFGTPAQSFTPGRDKRGKEAGPSRSPTPQSANSREQKGNSSSRYSESNTEKEIPVDNFQEPPRFDTQNASAGFQKSFGQTAASPQYFGTGSQVDRSPTSEGQGQQYDDIWLTVSEVPLFTQPTAAPPPSRPPPPIPRQTSRSETGSFSSRKKGDEFSSRSNHSQHSQSPKPARPAPKGPPVSQFDELEDFARGRSSNTVDESANLLSGEETNPFSTAAASAAMKEAMEKAEAKFRHAKEVREREYAKAARNKESVQQERHEEDWQEREFRGAEARLERERKQKEEEERERRRLEREREKARQAVERANREARERAAAQARERAAAEARSKAERVAVEKASAEARERAERVAMQRAQAEARERAAAEAKERAEKAAAEARERAAAAEVRDKAAVARAEAEARRRAERAAVERAAAEARERAAAAAKTTQQRNDDDLESFFSMGRASSAPRGRANSTDPFFDQQFQNQGGSEAAKRAPSSSGASFNMKKASSTTNIVDDLSSIFGAAPSSGEFQEVEGETEERRRARLERHQRTQERAAKALAEKNQRDLQAQKDQEERHRISETLDVEIKRWAAGKEGNLRALLSTLQYVLWPECGWQPVSLTDLITGASVKKVYRKATLCIHPDKVQQKGATLQQKYIAEKVFDLLKEAWNKFNSEELF